MADQHPTTSAHLRWVGGVAFEGEGMGGATVRADQPLERGGTGVGFRPTELLLHALAACLATTIVQVVAKQRQVLDGYHLAVEGERAEAVPARFVRITVKHTFEGSNLSAESLERIVHLVDEKYCSVSATLAPGLVQHHVRVVAPRVG